MISKINTIINSDCIEGMKLLPDNSVDCCVTSPPYFGLRDYGVNGQIGLEDTPEMFVAKMVEVFEQVRRVLKPEGTLWLNLGDSYSSHKDCKSIGQTLAAGTSRENAHVIEIGKSRTRDTKMLKRAGLKNKDLIGIPWMVAFALRSAGWYLRQDIIWHKPNPMPESVTDRCTKSHEYIFLMSKSAKYYYDAEAIKTPVVDATVQRLLQDVENQSGSDRVPGKTNGAMKAVLKGYSHRGAGDKKLTGHSGNYDSEGNLIGDGKANKKSVWTVTTKPFKEAHFATFPEDLIVDCIKAGSSEKGHCPSCGSKWVRSKIDTGKRREVEIYTGQASKDYESDGVQNPSDVKRRTLESQSIIYEYEWIASCGCGLNPVPDIVIDPFMGAGTTALVARKLNRNFIGFELNPEYIKIAEDRLRNELGMFV